MHLKTIAEKNVNRINTLLTQGKTVKSLHVIFEIIQAQKVSPQLKEDDEYASQCFKDHFLREEVINLCLRATVITPLILQQNPNLCFSKNLNAVSIHAWLSLTFKNSLFFPECKLAKKRVLKCAKPNKLLF